MADFENFESTGEANVEEDPAAEFLAREQNELAGLEDDNFAIEEASQPAEAPADNGFNAFEESTPAPEVAAEEAPQVSVETDLIEPVPEVEVDPQPTPPSFIDSIVDTEEPPQEPPQVSVETVLIEPEPEVQPKVEPLVETEVQPKVEPLVETEVQPKVQPLVETEVQPKVELLVETEVQPKVEPPVETEVQPKVEPPVETEVQPKVEPLVETEVQPKVEPPVETEVQPEVVPQVEPQAEPEVEPPVAVEPQPQVKVEPQPTPPSLIDTIVTVQPPKEPPQTNGPTDGGGYAAIAQADKHRQEPEKIRIWREEQKKRLEQKDAEEEVKNGQWREAAKKELEDWLKHHVEQLVKTKENNRAAAAAELAEITCGHSSDIGSDEAQEEASSKERDETIAGQEYEKICRLCDFNPKHSKNTKDVSRMRSILLQLKQTPLVR